MMLTQGQSRTGGQRRQHVAGVLGLEGEQTCLEIKEKSGREKRAERQSARTTLPLKTPLPPEGGSARFRNP